jgi:hypothetical protein
MKTGAPPVVRRSISLAAAGILAVMLTACTGAGGGYLAPGRHSGHPLDRGEAPSSACWTGGSVRTTLGSEVPLTA